MLERVAALLATLLSTASLAQSSPEMLGAIEAEEPPVQCWLKSAKTAVHVGEHFNVTLTCGVLDTPRLAAVPDLAQIEPATIQFPPFEVMGGTRRPDVKAGSRRYFQFEYTLRVIADGFFGRDLPIPPVTLKYSLSMATGGSAGQGRERTYILPAIPVRVMSLVPQQASDIQDASRNAFVDIERRRLRAQVASVSAGVLFAFAAVYLLLAATSGVARYRGSSASAPRRLSDAQILAACRSTLDRVRKRTRAEGWSPELAADGLAAIRIAAAIGLGHPVAQIVSRYDALPSVGQIAARMGVLRPRRVIVSASVTALSISTLLASNAPMFAPRLRPVLEKLRDALIVLTAVRYGSAAMPDAVMVGDAADSAASALRRLRLATLAPVRYMYALSTSVKHWSLVWTR